MKKLIMATAVICAAALTQAASITWNFGTDGESIYAGYKLGAIGEYEGTDVAKGASAYIVYFSEDNYGMSQSDLLAALRSGKKMDDASITANLVQPGAVAVGQDGTINTTVTGDSKWLDSDNTMSAYLAVIDGDNIFLTREDDYVWSETFADDRNIYPSVGSSIRVRDIDGTKDFGSAGWYSTVPEPTSGLLLLLGVAGLALRRGRRS